MSRSRRNSPPLRGRRSATLGVVLLAVLAAPAGADDWFVDANHGSDTHDGRSESTAWRTLTHAVAELATLPPAEHRVLVAPGTYDPALGEVFPLRPTPGVMLTALRPDDRPVVGGAPDALIVYASNALIDDATGARHLVLRNAAVGVRVIASTAGNGPRFEDLSIVRMSLDAIDVLSPGATTPAQTIATPTFEGLEIIDAGRGVHVRAFASSLDRASARVTIRDAVIRGSRSAGVRFSASGNAFTTVELERCRVIDGAGVGVYGSASGIVTAAALTARSCLIADNGAEGLVGETGTGAESGNYWLFGTTVAQNGVAGIRGEPAFLVDLSSCNVAGNGDDLDLADPPTASFTNCEDGDLLGQPGCIAVDPRFVDAPLGDFRLAWGSACIDRGDPTSAATFDLRGDSRTHDGDLDTWPAPDMGAFEHRTLDTHDSAAIGDTLTFEVSGPSGALALPLVSVSPLVAATMTPFGALLLDRSTVRFPPTESIPQAGPLLWRFEVPAHPSWIGRTLAVQFLIDTPAAPVGRALTNPFVALVTD